MNKHKDFTEAYSVDDSVSEEEYALLKNYREIKRNCINLFDLIIINIILLVLLNFENIVSFDNSSLIWLIICPLSISYLLLYYSSLKLELLESDIANKNNSLEEKNNENINLLEKKDNLLTKDNITTKDFDLLYKKIKKISKEYNSLQILLNLLDNRDKMTAESYDSLVSYSKEIITNYNSLVEMREFGSKNEELEQAFENIVESVVQRCAIVRHEMEEELLSKLRIADTYIKHKLH